MKRTLILALSLTLAACADSTRVETPAWTEAGLPGFTSGAVLFDIAFRSGRGLAVGAEVGPGTAKPVLLDNPGGSWGRIFPVDLPVSGTLTGVTFTKDGEGIAVGAEGVVSPLPLILDERGDWHRPSLVGATSGGLSAVVASGDSVWASGTADGGLFFMGTTALNWARVAANLGTPQEKGFNDLSSGGGVTYACGFDDGEAPFSVVLANSGSGWTKLAHPDPTSDDLEFDAILIDDEGTLWLGGHVTETRQSGGATLIVDIARLYRKLKGGSWAEIPVPDAEAVKSISDIAQMSTGTVYFAAEGDVRLFLWANDAVREVVLPELDGSLYGLAEGPGGYLYAAGTKLTTGASVFQPLILRGRVGP